MAQDRNYLLGFGERLTEKVTGVGRPMKKVHPYLFSEAKKRLAPRLQEASREIAALPKIACPQDECVAAVTLHPAYIAKTFFPLGLFREVGLEPIGSRPRQIVPEKGAKKPTAEQAEKKIQPSSPTAELFVVGKRQAFRRWAEGVPRWHEDDEEKKELIRVEDIRLVAPAERIKPMRSNEDTPLLEVVLHRSEDHVLDGFREYMRSLNVKVDLDKRIEVQGLCFLPVRVPRRQHERMAQFSFLRVAREMPSIRELRPGGWTGMTRSVKGFPVNIQHETPINPEIRVAVFDGGIPDGILPPTLVSRKKADGVGNAVGDSQGHGLAVTSALLFGAMEKGEAPPQPYAAVQHWRVIDDKTNQDPQGHYFDVLNRIMGVLRQKPFDFVNLSLGPDLPIEDDEVHVWTAALDQHFSHGRSLVAVAVGNNGDDDWDSGNARIQAPADGVNVLAVGACDSRGREWKRAGYSCVGPGRSPGLMKPEIVMFGGSDDEPFWVLDGTRKGYARGTQGTSFATPLALRAAIGVRAHLGSVVSPLALKALLIHHSQAGKIDPREVGWGRTPHDVDDLITCPDGKVHVLYQGELEAGKYLRARIPVPGADQLQGLVTITATFCFATETDPQDPLNYTRAGLDVAFRPHDQKFNETPKGKSKNPKTRSFFGSPEGANEEELRRDSHKWEPCMKSSERMQASGLRNPCFDIHYNARKGGMAFTSAEPIPYALLVTVESSTPDLYNKIATRYRTQLEPLMPMLQVPIKTGR